MDDPKTPADADAQLAEVDRQGQQLQQQIAQGNQQLAALGARRMWLEAWKTGHAAGYAQAVKDAAKEQKRVARRARP